MFKFVTSFPNLALSKSEWQIHCLGTIKFKKTQQTWIKISVFSKAKYFGQTCFHILSNFSTDNSWKDYLQILNLVFRGNVQFKNLKYSTEMIQGNCLVELIYVKISRSLRQLKYLCKMWSSIKEILHMKIKIKNKLFEKRVNMWKTKQL